MPSTGATSFYALPFSFRTSWHPSSSSLSSWPPYFLLTSQQVAVSPLAHRALIRQRRATITECLDLSTMTSQEQAPVGHEHLSVNACDRTSPSLLERHCCSCHKRLQLMRVILKISENSATQIFADLPFARSRQPRVPARSRRIENLIPAREIITHSARKRAQHAFHTGISGIFLDLAAYRRENCSASRSDKTRRQSPRMFPAAPRKYFDDFQKKRAAHHHSR